MDQCSRDRGRFTAAKYVEFLDEVLLPTVRVVVFPDATPFHLVQDNSPIHTANVVKSWFQQHSKITLLPHPPESPDLNPHWAAMSKRRDQNSVTQRSRSALIRNSLMAWKEFSKPEGQALTQSVMASMPSRLNSVFAGGGGQTKYWYIVVIVHNILKLVEAVKGKKKNIFYFHSQLTELPVSRANTCYSLYGISNIVLNLAVSLLFMQFVLKYKNYVFHYH